MTVVRPNSISGINSITVATGEALSIHGADGALVSTLTNTSGIATYKGIHVGSGTTTSNQGVIVGTGASIVSDAVNELSIYTNNTERFNINATGSAQIGISTFRILAGSAPKIGIGTYTPGYTIEALAASNPTLSIVDTTNAVTTQVRSNSTGALVRTASNHPLVFATNQTERLRIDANGLIANGALAPSDYGSPNLLISGTDSTLTMMGNGSTNSTSFTGIKFRVAGGSTGDYTKAGIFSRREGGYNDLSLIFALDTVADATSVSIADEKMRITSAGRVNIVGICSAAGGFVGDGSNLTNISGIPSEADTAVSSTSATTVLSLSASTYRAATVDVVITQGSAYQAGTYGLIHDGTTATIVEQWAIATGDMLGTFTATVSGGNMLMQVNMGSSSSATVTVKSSTITV